MAKIDSFDFDTDSSLKGGEGLNLEFLNNIKFLDKLTYSQKKLIFFSAILIVITVIICVALLIVSATGGFSGGNNGGINIGGGNNSSDDNGGADNNEDGDEGGKDLSIYGEIKDFHIYSTPYKTTYVVGEQPVYTGLGIMFTTDNAGDIRIYYEEEPENFTITGFDSSVATDKQTITVDYCGYTATFTVKISKVTSAVATLTGIHLDPVPPAEVPYGYPPDVTNAKIICTYSDGSFKEVDLQYEHLSNYEEDILAASPGDQVTINVVYSEGGITQTTSFTVTITE